jgi:hypothetical protein
MPPAVIEHIQEMECLSYVELKHGAYLLEQAGSNKSVFDFSYFSGYLLSIEHDPSVNQMQSYLAFFDELRNNTVGGAIVIYRVSLGDVTWFIGLRETARNIAHGVYLRIAQVSNRISSTAVGNRQSVIPQTAVASLRKASIIVEWNEYSAAACRQASAIYILPILAFHAMSIR